METLPQNKYINLVDISGNNVSILDTDVNYEYDMDCYDDFDIVKYSINHTLDESGKKLFYSMDKIDCMTNAWVAETMDLHRINYNGIEMNIGTDTEYRIYNKNKLASELFGIDVAGNVVFYFNEFLNETEIKEQLKSIKNSAIHSGLIDYKNIKIN
jgi:hypothetical protein